MLTKLTTKSDFRWVEAIDNAQAILFSDLLTLFKEFLASIAPATVGALIIAWGDDILNRNKEGVSVHTVELKGIFALTNAIICWETLSIIFAS